jgi:hypothetical protein
MTHKIRVSKEALKDLDTELQMAATCATRTLSDITNKEVRLILENPSSEIEVTDNGKVIGTIAVGLGAAGLGAAGLGSAAGLGAAGGAAGLGFGGGAAHAFAAAAAPAVAVPGAGWIIGGILLVAEVVAVVASYADKEKAVDAANQKQKLYQERIRKLSDELRNRKKDNNEMSARMRHLEKILEYCERGEAKFTPA